MTKYSIILFFLISLIFPSATLGHGNSQSFPKDVGIYTVEMEYDAVGVFDDTTMPFVFRLLDQKTKNSVEFKSILVRFEKKSDKSTIIVAKVVQDELQEGVGRLTALLNEGSYMVTLIFYGNDSKMAEVSYELNVERGESNQKFPVATVVGGFAGLVVGFLIAKINKRSNAK